MTGRFWRTVILMTLVVLSFPVAAFAAPAAGRYVVKPGDTLADIAWDLGVNAGELGRANGITNFNRIYPGQVLTVPDQSAAKPATVDKPASVEETATVENPAGVEKPADVEKLATVDKPASVEETAIVENPAGVVKPAGIEEPAVQDSAMKEPASAGKWIDVDLSEQRLSAYIGDEQVFTTLVSTGTANHPTPTGTFKILDRVRFEDMDGPGYYLKDVPNVMLFKRKGYAIHGTYWHDKFGTPMSHGCINMTIPDSAWLYDWAPNGTPVVVHD